MIITLKDGIRVEAEVSDNVRVASPTDKVDRTLDVIKPVLKKAVEPVVAVWKELNQEMKISEAQIELGFGFEASGDVFVASAKGNANFKVTLTLKPA
jgi:hypothetical protein